jgi:hypothetical protein
MRVGFSRGPDELPVGFPRKWDFVLNLKSAKALSAYDSTLVNCPRQRKHRIRYRLGRRPCAATRVGHRYLFAAQQSRVPNPRTERTRCRAGLGRQPQSSACAPATTHGRTFTDQGIAADAMGIGEWLLPCRSRRAARHPDLRRQEARPICLATMTLPSWRSQVRGDHAPSETYLPVRYRTGVWVCHCRCRWRAIKGVVNNCRSNRNSRDDSPLEASTIYGRGTCGISASPCRRDFDGEYRPHERCLASATNTEHWHDFPL